MVPDWYGGGEQKKQQRQQHKQQTTNKRTKLNEGQQEPAAGGGGAGQERVNSDEMGVTTRVLTDEKGHSIKVRIASPPARRHQELVQQLQFEQQRRQFEQQQQQQQRFEVGELPDWPPLEPGQLRRSNSSASNDFPPISLPSLIWDENGLELAPAEPPHMHQRSNSALGDGEMAPPGVGFGASFKRRSRRESRKRFSAAVAGKFVARRQAKQEEEKEVEETKRDGLAGSSELEATTAEAAAEAEAEASGA